MSEQRRVQYFDAAFALLADGGYGGLKQAALCERLGVTTGAFYHSFESWSEFTARLLEHWQTERTTRLVDLALMESDGPHQLDALLRSSLDLPHRAEAAIRVWSTIDPDVGQVQAAVDHARLDVVHRAFRDLVDDDAQAHAFARIALIVLIGFEQSDGDLDAVLLAQSLLMVKERAASGAGLPGA